MIKLIRTATLSRLRRDLNGNRRDVFFECERAECLREELAVAQEALAESQQLVATYSGLAERWHERLLAKGAAADAEFAGMLAVIKQVTGERDEAREQLHDAQRALAGRDQELEELGLLRAAARQEGLVLLLEWGRLHSIHRSVEAAKACAEKHGASPFGWGREWTAPNPDRAPASEVWWRWIQYVSRLDLPAGQKEPTGKETTP
ncbi:hypothetical protein [Streptomyces mayteni]